MNPSDPAKVAWEAAREADARRSAALREGEDPSLNVARVALRVDQGGHEVPAERIAPRYERALRNAVLARRLADELWLYDNSRNGLRPRRVARYVAGELVSVRQPIPEWLRRACGPEIDAWLSNLRRP